MFLVLCSIFIAHALTIVQGWYITHQWVDIPLHIAGGAWVAFVFFYFQRRHILLFSALPFWFSLLMVVGFVMLVGVAWEWLEFGFDYFFAKDNFLICAQLGLADTMGDLVMDLLGGMLVGLYFLLKKSVLKT